MPQAGEILNVGLRAAPWSVTFEWIERGVALVMRLGDAATPAATWIIVRENLSRTTRSYTPMTAACRASAG